VLESATELMIAEPLTAAPLELVLESQALAPVVTEPKPVVMSAAIEESLKAALAQPAATAPAPVREEPKPAAPALPQGFEGLKFPNDGVLTRQWMEFLSQMSSAK